MTEPVAFPLAYICPSPPHGALSAARKADAFRAASTAPATSAPTRAATEFVIGLHFA